MGIPPTHDWSGDVQAPVAQPFRVVPPLTIAAATPKATGSSTTSSTAGATTTTTVPVPTADDARAFVAPPAGRARPRRSLPPAPRPPGRHRPLRRGCLPGRGEQRRYLLGVRDHRRHRAAASRLGDRRPGARTIPDTYFVAVSYTNSQSAGSAVRHLAMVDGDLRLFVDCGTPLPGAP